MKEYVKPFLIMPFKDYYKPFVVMPLFIIFFLGLFGVLLVLASGISSISVAVRRTYLLSGVACFVFATVLRIFYIPFNRR